MAKYSSCRISIFCRQNQNNQKIAPLAPKRLFSAGEPLFLKPSLTHICSARLLRAQFWYYWSHKYTTLLTTTGSWFPFGSPEWNKLAGPKSANAEDVVLILQKWSVVQKVIIDSKQSCLVQSLSTVSTETTCKYNKGVLLGCAFSKDKKWINLYGQLVWPSESAISKDSQLVQKANTIS